MMGGYACSAKKGVLLLSATFMLLPTACQCRGGPPGYSELCTAGRSERPRLLRQFDPEQQVALYLAVMQRIHPPDLGLADVVAELGERGVLIVAEKLEASSSDVERVDLCRVLVRMQELGTYDVRGSSTLQRVVAKAIEDAKDEDWRAELREDSLAIGWHPSG